MPMSGSREIYSESALPHQHDAAAGERQPCSNEHHAVEEISPQRSVLIPPSMQRQQHALLGTLLDKGVANRDKYA
jgi:hypothetical protein